MDDKVRDWFEAKDEFFCKLLQEDEDTDTYEALLWIMAINWNPSKINGLINNLRDYGKPEPVIAQVRKQWNDFMVRPTGLG